MYLVTFHPCMEECSMSNVTCMWIGDLDTYLILSLGFVWTFWFEVVDQLLPILDPQALSDPRIATQCYISSGFRGTT